jgi:uncharacterized protein (TIGR02266 family)
MAVVRMPKAMPAAKKAAPQREERTEARFSPIHSQEIEAQQRRSESRFAVDLDVGLGSDHNFYAGFAENLSAGGIFVATHLLKPVGSSIELSIHLPDLEAPIVGKGEVRWVREYNERSDMPPGMGIRFNEIGPEAQTAIEKFLKQREPLFFDDE